MFVSAVSSRIRLRAEKMDHDLSGFLETIHQSRLDRLLQGMSNSCSSPTPVAVLDVKGQIWGELEEHQTKRHIQF